MEKSKEEIINDLREMFKEADLRKWWFYSPYQQLWFSPNELRKAQSEDRFIWGKSNWIIRNPQERVEELKRERDNKQKELENFVSRINS